MAGVPVQHSNSFSTIPGIKYMYLQKKCLRQKKLDKTGQDRTGTRHTDSAAVSHRGSSTTQQRAAGPPPSAMPSLSLSLFLFMLSSVLSLSSSLSSPPSTEFLALHSFFNSTNGHSWEPRCSVNWNFTCLEVGGECPDPCSFSQPWFGVSCFGSNVSSLNLIGCQLSGSLPDALNDLLVLSTLYLDDNNLTSTFPAITKPFRLTQLQAGGNKFTGPFPDLHWGLFSVYLANNFLTGSIYHLLTDMMSYIYMQCEG